MIILILILVGLIGITVYFQNSIVNANEKFNVKSNEFDIIKQELQYQINQFNNLNNTYIDLNSDLNDYTTEFDQVYGSCRLENDGLKKQLNITKNLLKERNIKLKSIQKTLEEIKTDIYSSYSSTPKIIDYIEDIKQLSNNALKEIDDEDNSNMSLSDCKSLLGDLEDDFDDNENDATLAKSSLEKINDYLDNANSELMGIITSLRKY